MHKKSNKVPPYNPKKEKKERQTVNKCKMYTIRSVIPIINKV